MMKVLVKGVIVLLALLVTLVQATTAGGNRAFAQQKVGPARSTRKTVTTAIGCFSSCGDCQRSGSERVESLTVDSASGQIVAADVTGAKNVYA